MTPQQAIRLAETHKSFTVKEREKVLAIALIELLKRSSSEHLPAIVKLKVLWEFSQMISEYPIPDLHVPRAIAMHKNPKDFRNYK